MDRAATKLHGVQSKSMASFIFASWERIPLLAFSHSSFSLLSICCHQNTLGNRTARSWLGCSLQAITLRIVNAHLRAQLASHKIHDSTITQLVLQVSARARIPYPYPHPYSHQAEQATSPAPKATAQAPTTHPYSHIVTASPVSGARVPHAPGAGYVHRQDVEASTCGVASNARAQLRWRDLARAHHDFPLD